MEVIQKRLESWVNDQRAKILKVNWGPLHWRMKWPPWNNSINNDQRKRIQEEYERRKEQLHRLCQALKAESFSDLQDILCCMALSECVYKRPATEMVRAVNKFKADFGGQIVSLERVQPSSDHVPHSYLLAETGDTLFASFIGTKQYKDIMTDANILQGVIFHEECVENSLQADAVDSREADSGGKGNGESRWNPLEPKPKKVKDIPKPAAHRGFMGRAKGIPALELYRLAQKKNRKLVLCGHSLGGAVAALATLAILRVIAVSSTSKENGKVQVKCITFSQPPVGNAALKDYVNRKGWQNYFKSYCIPEDLVPRILSPAYFHHYNAQPMPPPEVQVNGSNASNRGDDMDKLRSQKSKEEKGEQLVMGLGPIQTSFWRLSRLVPLEGVRRQFNKYRGKPVDHSVLSSGTSSTVTSGIEDVVIETRSLEIQEGSDGVSLKPMPATNNENLDEAGITKLEEKTNKTGDDGNTWRRVPYLPSYVPFGQLFLLENSSVELLSGAEYTKLTSVKSVIAELRERLQSHSMKSYRSRFQRIYDLCMGESTSSFFGVEQLPQFPHLQQWLGLAAAGAVELAHIVESPSVCTATSVVPIGWSGIPGEKNGEPLKVDITGFRLHLCNLVHAQVNGNWCSTVVESFPTDPNSSLDHEVRPELQKLRILVGPPLRKPPTHHIVLDSLKPVFPPIDSEAVNIENSIGSTHDEKFVSPEGLNSFFIFFTSDFVTISKEVHTRLRRVRLLGLEGAGKTSLFKGIIGQARLPALTNFDILHTEHEVQEGIACGVCYSDSAGVNLQDLNKEVCHFRDELWMGMHDLNKRTDLIVLVHNLSHKIPQYKPQSDSQQQPALALLLNEAKALGVPWVLAITNKFSVSAHQQKAAIDAVVQAYHASLSTMQVINSCPYVIPTSANLSLPWRGIDVNSNERSVPKKLIFAPMNFVRLPFQKKETIFPVEGVDSLCQLVHRVLRTHEEDALQELARDSLMVELARGRGTGSDVGRESGAKESSMTAATIGASLGAGLGLILAVVMGAASALRKP